MSSTSIHNLAPLDQSGRSSRSGFIYQDHVGIHFCLEMLLKEELKQVWIEREDDISLINVTKGVEWIEFIQVKHYEAKPSRWSLADVVRKDTNGGLSLFEKLLKNDRCSEKTKFRIVSSFPAKKKDLGFLEIESEVVRKQYSSDKDKLVSELNKKCPNFLSTNGNGWDYFVTNCIWSKFPGTIDTLRSVNILKLETVLSILGLEVSIQTRENIYESLLRIVRDASIVDLKKHPDGYKITCDFLEDWLIQEVEAASIKTNKSKLTQKMEDAEIPEDVINAANHLRVRYKNDRLKSTYVHETEFSDLEQRIEHFLHAARVDWYSGVLSMSRAEFHGYCLREVNRIGANMPSSSLKFIAAGFMYDVTNRCMHKFSL